MLLCWAALLRLLTRLLSFVTKLVNTAHYVRRKVNVGRRKHVVFERPTPQANGNSNADNGCPDFGDAYIRDLSLIHILRAHETS